MWIATQNMGYMSIRDMQSLHKDPEGGIGHLAFMINTLT
jgi:hypothetical protein